MDIISFITNTSRAGFVMFQDYLLYFYILGFFVSLYFVVMIAYYMAKTNYVKMRVDDVVDTFRARTLARRRVLRAWKKIKERLRTQDEAQCKLALVEADRLLNDIFVMAGLPGRNLDERLAMMDPAQVSNYQEVVAAHRIAMRAFSDTAFSLTPSEADAVILIYKRAFQELGLVGEI